MSLPGDLEAKVIGWATKDVVYIVGFVIAAALLLFLYFMVFVKPGQDAAALTRANAQGVVGAADAAAAHGAIGTISGVNNAEGGVGAKGRDAYVYITKKPGAETVVPDPVWSAIIERICMRDSAAGDPQCQRLPKPNP